jgi:hypothetical protein
MHRNTAHDRYQANTGLSAYARLENPAFRRVLWLLLPDHPAKLTIDKHLATAVFYPYFPA